jgi:thymidylate kinase
MVDNKKAILLLIRGLPGSGKSYIANLLKEEIGDQMLLLDPDATDYKSNEYKEFSKLKLSEGIDEKFHPYRFLREQAYTAIKNDQIIAWNQAFTNLDGLQKTVINLQDYAKEHAKNLPVMLVEVEIDPEVAKKRVAVRASKGGHNVNEEEFKRFINDYRSFKSEGFDVVSVRGDSDIRDIIAKIKDKLEEITKN